VMLKGRNGNEVEIAFSRDSLPDPQDGFGDSECFTAVVRGATADDSWEESSPCLGSTEFRNLADWLEAVGSGSEGESSEVELLEPELKFSVMQENPSGVGIRVNFHLQ